jgi:hypothetical protein
VNATPEGRCLPGALRRWSVNTIGRGWHLSLSDFAAVASLINSAAVVISLIYLGLQVNQAERNQRASIRHGRATRSVDIILAMSEPSMGEALPKGVAGAEDITPAQFGQFTAIYGAFLASAEDSYLQHGEGLLSDAVFASLRASWAQTLSQPGVRALWRLRRVGFEAGFVAFMDAIMAEVSVAAAGDFMADWKAAVALAKAGAVGWDAEKGRDAALGWRPFQPWSALERGLRYAALIAEAEGRLAAMKGA